jgi:hypothetical protein
VDTTVAVIILLIGLWGGFRAGIIYAERGRARFDSKKSWEGRSLWRWKDDE